jgi:aminoglycoside phosphotransferase (APT) family kinase protein
LGHGTKTRRYILRGLSQDAAHLKNRGIGAIFAKSLLGPPRKRESRKTLKCILDEVESALGHPVTHAQEITAWGYSRKEKYLISVGDRRHILRMGSQGDFLVRIAVLERVRAAGVPAPAVPAWGQLGAKDSEPTWLLEEWLPGSFDPAHMSPAEFRASVTDLGQYLRRLHSIRIAGFGRISSAEFDAPHRTFEAWLDRQYHSIQEACAIGAVSEAQLPALETADRLLRRSFSGPPALCHDDLTSGNLLFEGGRLRGIVDWEYVAGDDPAYDLAVFLTDMRPFWNTDQNKANATSILNAYGADDPNRFTDRVLAHTVLFTATELAKPIHNDNLEYRAMCRSLMTETDAMM